MLTTSPDDSLPRAKVRRTLALFAASTIAALGLANLAHASEPFAPPSVSVKYDDLNPSSDAGSHQLYSRLRAAAHSVCDHLPSSQLANRQLRERCYEQSLSRAVDSLGLESVASLHRAATSARIADQSKSDSKTR